MLPGTLTNITSGVLHFNPFRVLGGTISLLESLVLVAYGKGSIDAAEEKQKRAQLDPQDLTYKARYWQLIKNPIAFARDYPVETSMLLGLVNMFVRGLSGGDVTNKAEDARTTETLSAILSLTGVGAALVAEKSAGQTLQVIKPKVTDRQAGNVVSDFVLNKISATMNIGIHTVNGIANWVAHNPMRVSAFCFWPSLIALTLSGFDFSQAYSAIQSPSQFIDNPGMVIKDGWMVITGLSYMASNYAWMIASKRGHGKATNNGTPTPA